MTRSGLTAHKSRSHVDIEREAFRLRGRLCVGTKPHEPIPAGVELFERIRELKITVRNEPYAVDYDVQEMPEGTLGWTRFEGDRFIIGVGPETYEGLRVGDPEARFVFAHELGHLRLHPRELMDMYWSWQIARSLRRDRVGGFDEAESQADNFAGAFLVPAAGLEMMSSSADAPAIQTVVHRFGVREDLAKKRREIFGRWRPKLLKADSYASPDDDWPAPVPIAGSSTST